VVTPSQISTALFFTLLQLSLCTWLWLAWKRARRQEVFPAVQQEPLKWHGEFACLAISCAFLAPGGMVALMRPGTEPSLRLVQTACAVNFVQALFLMLAFFPAPVREKMGLRFSWTDLRLAGLVFIASLVPVYALNLAVSWLGWRAEGGVHSYFHLIAADPTPRTLIWIAVSVLIAAPIVEELLYRVIMQGWLESVLPGRVALFIVAVVFALVHWRPGRPDHIPLFAFALALGYLYHRRRSFLAVALVHSLFNGMNLTMALLVGPEAP